MNIQSGAVKLAMLTQIECEQLRESNKELRAALHVLWSEASHYRDTFTDLRHLNAALDKAREVLGRNHQ